MVAVTIGVGEKYELLARLSGQTCSRMTGLDVRVLGADAMKRQGVARPHHLKFRIFEECRDHDNLMYFDSDMVFLKPFDVAPFAGRAELVCVRDMPEKDYIIGDAKKAGITPGEYFNSGLLFLNRIHHSELLHLGERLAPSHKSLFFDQTPLNAARARLSIPLKLLPKEYNYLDFHRLEKSMADIVVGHVGDLEKRPADIIIRYFQFWARSSASHNETVARLKRDLVSVPHDYERVGHDRRPMEFLADGRVGRGGARCELSWDMSIEDGEIVLWIAAASQPTCALTRDADGVWTGRWLDHEKMPVRLRPLRP